MNRKINVRIASFLLMLGAFQANAQQTVSLKNAIQYALQNKADAIKAQLNVRNSEYQIAEAKAGALPTVTGTGALNYNPILQKSALPGEFFNQPGTVIMVPFGQKWNSSVGVSLQQALFNQQVFVGLKAAKTTKEFYQINKQLTEEQIIEKVSTAYYQVFSQQQKLEAVESSYESTLKARNIIKSLFDNGLAKKVDLDRTNVNLTNLETNRSQLKNAVTLQENALKFYMGMPIEEPIALVKDDVQIDSQLLTDQINTDNRTEVKVLEKRKQLLQYNVEATKAAYYPTLSLVGNYAWQGLGGKFPIGPGKSQGVYWSDYASVGLSLNIPIFNGFLTKSKVDQAKIQLETLEQDLKDTKLSMSMEYRNAKAQMENSLDAIKNQTANMELAQTVLDNTRSNYQYGLATLTELLDAENALVQAKNNYSNSLYDYKIAEVQMYKAKGELSNLTK
ncbi:transporter [Elizabethkingia meningoseptica]|uniref:TolC family protein n=1 Tax=Elizabethkingia meningoseptica TaxID=238 RepID=UPI000332C427|nr:TolC family protein [Elizabethkingia meningoseptica]AQX05444.1 transporter [Elizabethkingia meningoseptica]AQX47487.1 transporter [Elizabethkingia meningoseptica]EJK5330122.1 TolC family protein [Elizabethkingia meningoseptica]EOR29735.1 outer membrane efflux protein [Elizabethkingia meningoseptica ATCC 13253 = NBRC 12535]KUY24247.1 transporter [Elizabethkingia meningoseptica]